MSDEPEDDLIEPGIFLRLRRLAGWSLLVIMLVGTPAAVIALCVIALGAFCRNVVMRLAPRPRLKAG